MAGTEKFGGKNFHITREEVDQIGEALKCEEFRKLLAEYAEEVSDPANVKLYQEEMTQLEKERGVDVTFINPEPGYVIKTSVDGNRKAFLNICKNENVVKPTSQPVMSGNSRGFNWLLPHSLAPPRDDADKNRNRCVVYDVVFHPEAFDLAESNPKFKSMLTETALDAVENNFNVKLDRRNVRYPKIRFKGALKPAVIRKNVEGAAGKDADDDLLPDIFKLPADENESTKPKKEKIVPRPPAVSQVPEPASYTTPKYSVIHRSCLDMQDFANDRTANINATIPKELAVEVNLPLLSSSADVVLDVMEKSLLLVSESPAKYKLELQLPYHVDEERGSAKFDQSARKLIVTLPVKFGSKPCAADAGREDSGVECDHSCRTSESGSGDEVGVESKQGANEDALRTNNFPTDADVGYRTSDKAVQLFLKSDLCYSLPTFTCNTVDSMVVFTLHVKNVDASTVERQYIGESGIHVKFVSIGCCVEEESVNIETWDNNVILQLQFRSCDSVLTDYLVGVDEGSAVKHILPEPAAIGEKLRNIEVS
ncbi:hypothetical protein PR048_026035 [Dryococelus australis]|uniref:Protein kintoun n=1 Tax=Dryococelus australis TaxID=614101 RepID=A0ABQ9GK79_9NEOP|nr:hypothetical protein PR048_026035 [Dryococelus australis]